MNKNNRVYIDKKVYCLLCDEGKRLHDEWESMIELHAGPEYIYSAMLAYYSHRNGVITKNYSKKQGMHCTECSEYREVRE